MRKWGKEGKIAAVAEINPLKQGLKQQIYLTNKHLFLRCRDKSTKTRIETMRKGGKN